MNRKELEEALWKMHKIVHPGEYGLGSEPESVLDEKDAWERLGTLLDEALEHVRAEEQLDEQKMH